MDELDTKRLEAGDLEELREARALLERSNLFVRVAELVGKPIEAGLAQLPARAGKVIHDATELALRKALAIAIWTLGSHSKERRHFHRLAAALSGAAGGTFGLGGLAVELPVSTVLMLRSIGGIARNQGHDLDDPRVQLACLEVFALGSGKKRDEAAETAYYAVRAALAKALSDAARHIAAKGLSQKGAPALVRLVQAIASRFGIVVQQKVALEAVPVAGALGGAFVNVAFTEHFQRLARGHFIVLRLEKRYGSEAVRAAYEALDPGAEQGGADEGGPEDSGGERLALPESLE